MRLCMLLVLVGCQHPGGEEAGHGHGHSHGDDHGHGHGDGHGAAEGPEPFAVTRWTATHELFVEFDPPVVGQAVPYHAHVTRLADNHAATEGVFEVEWLDAQGGSATAFVALAVKRRGIFAFEAPAPATAGTYALRFTYRNGDEEATWDGGTHALSTEPATPPDTPTGEISFLKEAQWQIPFETAVLQPQTLARRVPVVAVVEAQPGQVHGVTAPAAGRLEWTSPVAVGRRVAAGTEIGRLVPAAAGDHWSTLRQRVLEGEVDARRLEVEVQRLTGLARDGLVPARQLDEARAELARARVRLEAARQQQSQGRGTEVAALSVVAPADGVVVELPLAEGAPVAPGDVVMRVVADGPRRLHARVLLAEVPDYKSIRAAALTTGEPLALALHDALVVDSASGLAPLYFEAPPGDWALGARLPVVLTVGETTEQLAAPRGAIVEINTRPFVFVMVGGEGFTRRPVTLGAGSATHVGIASGLTAGERVVVRGAFDVHVASLSGGLASHRH